MIHIIYISIIVLVLTLAVSAFNRLSVELRRKDAAIKFKETVIADQALIIAGKDNSIQHVNNQYDELLETVWTSAQTWDQTSKNFREQINDRDEELSKRKKRNEFLEHIVTEMVLLPK